MLRDYMESQAKPVRLEQISSDFKLDNDETIALRHRLRAMARAGELICNRQDAFCLTEKLPIKIGTVLAHRDGYGFLSPEDGTDDVFLPPRCMRSLMHRDRAAVRVQRRSDGRWEGRLVEVLDRSRRHVAGQFFDSQGLSFVRPDDPRLGEDVLVPKSAQGNAKEGDMVSVELTRYPDGHGPAIGRVVEVLGSRNRPGMAVDLAIRNHELPFLWPDEVTDLVDRFPNAVLPEDIAGRRDLRDLPLVTIDGEDARDFDDAIYCKTGKTGYRLFVAIADVSHYVEPHTALDREAEIRGNSVYFPQRVIPMLPEALSNGLCSLNPGVDRLCVVAEMNISAEGEVYRSRFYTAVMRSVARLTYTQVAQMLDEGGERQQTEHAGLLPQLRVLQDCYVALAKARAVRGAIDFDSVETRFLFDSEGQLCDLQPVVRNEAHRIVEESMIAANAAVGRHLMRAKVPSLYRVHERPPPDRLSELRDFLGLHGLNLGGGEKPEASDYTQLLHKLATRPDRLRIETMLLRSLAQANYQSVPRGHFGLALEHYAHFTSPIRRYPDLVVHRALKYLLEKKHNEGELAFAAQSFEEIARHCSATERRADEATREASDTLKAEFMKGRVGEEFDGLVVGITGFGLFVELAGLYIEGLVHISSLQADYYSFDNKAHRLRGENTGQSFGIGDSLRVRLVRVSVEERKIDLQLVNSVGARKFSKPRHRRRSKR